MSLYRKYRPQNFSEIVGQNAIQNILHQAVQLNRLSHAYLFSGPRGTGKTSTARILAKALNCAERKTNEEPCNECLICRQMSDGKFPDLIEIDAASNRGIDEIRLLREKINFLPSQGKKKVYIIDEVHMLTKEAFNALLKTLEEPPEHVIFILATTEVTKIPDTVISRCQHFHFKRINDADLVHTLKKVAEKEGIQMENEVFSLIAAHAHGGLRDALSLLDQIRSSQKLTVAALREEIGYIDQETLDDFWQAIHRCDEKQALQTIDMLFQNGYQLEQSCLHIILFLREMMKKDFSNQGLIEIYIFSLEAFEQARMKLKSASIPQLPLEIAILKICHFIKAKQGNTNPIPPTIHSPKPVLPSPVISETMASPTVTMSTVNHIPPPSQVTEMLNETKPAVSEAHPSNNTVENIRNRWEMITQTIKTPFARITLKKSTVIKYLTPDLYLQIPTNFESEKISQAEIQKEIMDSIFEHTGQNVRLVFEVGPQKAAPSERQTPPPPVLVAESRPLSYEEIKQSVEEIFQ